MFGYLFYEYRGENFRLVKNDEFFSEYCFVIVRLQTSPSLKVETKANCKIVTPWDKDQHSKLNSFISRWTGRIHSVH